MNESFAKLTLRPWGLRAATLAVLTLLAAPAARAAEPGAEPAGDRGPALGAEAPDFELPAVGGGTVRLSDFRGESPVVLVFFRGAW